jgi:hypothetical protein
MVHLTEVSPGCWFLFPGDNGKRLCMRVRPSPTEVTQELGYVELARFSPSRSLEPRLCISRDEGDAAVFALSDVQVEVPADLSSVYPDGRRKDTKARWKPGALIVAGEEYRLIVVDPYDEIAMVSLADGSFYRDGEQREMAVITRWRLVHNIEGHARTLLHFYLVHLGPSPSGLFFPASIPFSTRTASGCSFSLTATTGHSMSGSALTHASESRVTSIRELLLSASEKSLVSGENHLPQLREFRNIRIVCFLCDACLKFKGLPH